MKRFALVALIALALAEPAWTQTCQLLWNGTKWVNGTLSGTTITPCTTSGSPPSSHYVSLTWTASTSSGVNGHRIYRGTTKGGPYTLIQTIGNATTYTDNTVTAGTTYYYVTTSLVSGLESSYSIEASASVPSP